MRAGYRLILTISAWIVYLVSFNLYAWNLANTSLLPETKKLWYCYTTGLILTFYTIDGWRGYTSFMHDAIAKATMITVISNFLLICLIHHGLILDKPILRVCIYQLIWLTVSTMILVSSWKNGLFKKT